MTIDSKYLGRKYGPFTYEVGAEKLREFAYAVGGTVPSAGFSGVGAPKDMHPWLWDSAAAKDSPYGSIIGMPNFAVAFAIAPFGKAVVDEDLGINLLMLVHGEQEFEFHAPIKPGDVMTTTGEITGINRKANLDFLTVTTESRNQQGELVVKGVWTAVIRT